MRTITLLLTAPALALVVVGAVPAGDQAAGARLVPPTRPEMKAALEALKHIKPRIPLPEPTEAELAKLGQRGGYEARLRLHYMPGGDGRGGMGFGRAADPNMSLTYEFKTRLFWIVSRSNNCHY